MKNKAMMVIGLGDFVETRIEEVREWILILSC